MTEQLFFSEAGGKEEEQWLCTVATLFLPLCSPEQRKEHHCLTTLPLTWEGKGQRPSSKSIPFFLWWQLLLMFSTAALTPPTPPPPPAGYKSMGRHPEFIPLSAGAAGSLMLSNIKHTFRRPCSM